MKRLVTRYRVLAIVLATVVIAVAFAAGAFAAQSSDTKIIYAAVNSQDGTMRIVAGPTAKLSKNEYLLQWNQVGPTGPAGPAGTNGLDGANGINGTDGTNGVSIVWLGELGSAPSSPDINNAYYDSTKKKSFVWDGDSWEILAQDGADGTGGAAASLDPWTSVAVTAGDAEFRTAFNIAPTDGFVVASAFASGYAADLMGQTEGNSVRDIGGAGASVTFPVRAGQTWFVLSALTSRSYDRPGWSRLFGVAAVSADRASDVVIAAVGGGTDVRIVWETGEASAAQAARASRPPLTHVRFFFKNSMVRCHANWATALS